MTIGANPGIRPQFSATSPATEAPERPRNERRVRTTVTRAAGFVSGVLNAASGIPEGAVAGYMAHRGRDADSIRKALAVTQLTAHTLAGGAIGWLIGGPAGLVCGLAAGYIGGSLGNYMENRSTQLDSTVEHVKAAADAKPGLIKSVWAGMSQGAREGFAQGSVSGQATAAGALDAVSFLRQHDPQRPEGLVPKRPLAHASGVLFGAAGVLINAPAGAVLGALESIHEQDKATAPSDLSRHLLLLATNIGKVLPGVLVGTLVAGPLGLLAGTAVGVLTASVTSMVDGKAGFHPRLVRTVRESVDQAHGGTECPDSARVFYRAGKGAVVGFWTGLMEGWREGRDAGIQLVRDGISGPVTAAGHQPEPEKPAGKPAP